MDLIKQAFTQLFPQKEFLYTTRVTFSSHFKAYNASIVKQSSYLEVRASRAWKEVSSDIFLGLVQSLLVKIFGQAQNTYHMKLYDEFIKNVHISIPPSQKDTELEEAFARINLRFFSNTLEFASIQWGSYSTRKLGSYDFQTDTIVISRALQGKDYRLLDYVMFHEMLHKKLKFSKTAQKKHFHTAQFKEWEKQFPQLEEIEHDLQRLVPPKNRKGLLVWINERFK